MDKDTLKAIKIINEILGEIAKRDNYLRDFINTKRQDLYKIIADEECEGEEND